MSKKPAVDIGRKITEGFDNAGCDGDSVCCARLPNEKELCKSKPDIRDTPDKCDGFTGEKTILGGPAHCIHKDTLKNKFRFETVFQ